MKVRNKKAFTLIELLVVVLIIGILSAIALPQYKKAVFKARAAEAIQVLKSLRDAQAICILEHGATSDSCAMGNGGSKNIGELFDNISINIPGEIGESEALDGKGIKSKYFLYGIVSYTNEQTALLCAERLEGTGSYGGICTSANPNASVYFNQLVCGFGDKCAFLGFKKVDDSWIL